MKELFQRLEAQLSAQFPDVLHTLNPPASKEQIALFETTIQQKLPEDIKNAYLWRNGCRCLPGETSQPISGESYFLIDQGRWLSLDEMLTQWHFQIEIAEGDEYSFTKDDDPEAWGQLVFRPWCMAPPAWIPISRQSFQSHIYIDLMPGPRGRHGQLIDHNIQGYWHLIAMGFDAYIATLTRALELKKLQYDCENQQWLGLNGLLEKKNASL